MAFPALHGINPRSIHAAVPQDVSQPDDILLQRVVRPGEQVPQIVGEHLALRHPGILAQCFHFMPDIAPVQGLPAPGDKYRPGGDSPLPGVSEQRLLQLSGQENRP